MIVRADGLAPNGTRHAANYQKHQVYPHVNDFLCWSDDVIQKAIETREISWWLVLK